LISEIPANIFAGKSNIRYLNYTFQSCANLVNINSDSLAGLINCENYSCCFMNTGIADIPDNFFPNIGSSTFTLNFTSCFSNTKIAKVPSNLFKYGNSRIVSSCFANCTELVEVENN